jgi:hypothetical protein
MRDSMQEFVARENIQRFERQIAKTTDEAERTLLLSLLHEENKKLQSARIGIS